MILPGTELTHTPDFLQLILPLEVTEVHGIIHTGKGNGPALEPLPLLLQGTARFSNGISHKKNCNRIAQRRL